MRPASSNQNRRSLMGRIPPADPPIDRTGAGTRDHPDRRGRADDTEARAAPDYAGRPQGHFEPAVRTARHLRLADDPLVKMTSKETMMTDQISSCAQFDYGQYAPGLVHELRKTAK